MAAACNAANCGVRQKIVYEFVLVIIVVIAVLLVLLVVVGVLYLISRIPKIGGYISASIVFFLCYQVFRAVWPSDSYYVQMFTYESGIKFVESPKVLKKFATYPDFHGDFSAWALIQGSDFDLKGLRKDLVLQLPCSLSGIEGRLSKFDLSKENIQCWHVKRKIDQRLHIVQLKAENAFYFSYYQH